MGAISWEIFSSSKQARAGRGLSNPYQIRNETKFNSDYRPNRLNSNNRQTHPENKNASENSS